MAFITFLRHKKVVAAYRLMRPAIIGRSMDCDIFVPDVYLSRRHCRIEERDGSWWIVDLQSSNGTWHHGTRSARFLLKPGDVIEIGTVAMVFNAGEPEGVSNPAPFGLGLGPVELMDTICTDGLRPADYSKRQAARKQAFVDRVKAQLSAPDEPEELASVGHNPFGAPWQLEEWAELDLEQTLVQGSDELDDWLAPIFNPSPEVARVARYGGVSTAVATQRSAPTMPHSLAAHGERPLQTASDDYAVEPQRDTTARPRPRPVPTLPLGEAPTPLMPRQPLRTRVRGLLGFRRAASRTIVNAEGCVFESATLWDRCKAAAAERLEPMRDFARVNPIVAALVLLGLLGGAVIAYRSSSLHHKGPHLYVPPKAEQALAAAR